MVNGSGDPLTVVRFHVPATDCVGLVESSEPHPARNTAAAVQTIASILRMTLSSNTDFGTRPSFTPNAHLNLVRGTVVHQGNLAGVEPSPVERDLGSVTRRRVHLFDRDAVLARTEPVVDREAWPAARH